jgi:hypothetical protein
VILAALAVWNVGTWRRVARHGKAFVSLLTDSASLLMYAGTFVYSRLTPDAFMVTAGNPATAVTGIALFGLLLALGAFGFGIISSTTHERGGASATLLAVVMGLLWLPASFV